MSQQEPTNLKKWIEALMGTADGIDPETVKDLDHAGAAIASFLAEHPALKTPLLTNTSMYRDLCARIAAQIGRRRADALLAAPAPAAPLTAGQNIVRAVDGIYVSEPSSVVLSGGALAGVVDGLGGDSGAIRIEITDHEIVDMALSGQAYSLDGRFNFKNKSRLLDEGWAAREKQIAPAPAAPHQDEPPQEVAPRVPVSTEPQQDKEKKDHGAALLPADPSAPVQTEALPNRGKVK